MKIKRFTQQKRERIKRRARSGNLLYRFTRAVLRIYSMLMFNMDIEHKVVLPYGPKIFVANHPTLTDPFLLHIKEPMSMLITEEAFAIPVVGGLLRKIGQISAQSGSGTLEKASKALRHGRSVGIFPEGTNSPQSGGIKPGRSGAARLALMSGVPVVPVGIHLRKNRFFKGLSYLTGRPIFGLFYLWGRYTMTYGQPLRFTGDVEDRELVKKITDTLMSEIATLAEESEVRTAHKLKRTMTFYTL